MLNILYKDRKICLNYKFFKVMNTQEASFGYK